MSRFPLWTSLLLYAILGVAAWTWIHVSKPRLNLKLWRSESVARDAAAGLAAGLAVVGVVQLGASRVRKFRSMETEFRSLLGRIPPGLIPILAVASGIGEEYFFRGALQTHLGIVVQAVAFGLLHWPVNERMIAWPFFALAAGLLFGALTLWAGNLWPAVLAHATINQVNLTILTMGNDERVHEPVR